MAENDIFQIIDSLDPDLIQRIVDRLEFRGTEEAFIRMRDQYMEALDLSTFESILDLGCGTGVVTRALVTEYGYRNTVIGVDFSPALIEAAKFIADEQGLRESLEFRVGDAQSLEEANETYDLIILHTLISHVPKPAQVISEVARILKPGGKVVFYDGDYASLTYGISDHEEDESVVNAILSTIVANPYVMRELPGMLNNYGLALERSWGNVLLEVGELDFFMNLAETYIPMVKQRGAMDHAAADVWLNSVRTVSRNNMAFGSCNYCSYIAQQPAI